MTDCDSDKEWLIHLSLNKLFKWKLEGTHSLYKQVLVTNLLLAAGFPRLFLFGNPEYKMSPEKPLRYAKDRNQAETSAATINQEEEINDSFSISPDNGLIIDQLLNTVRSVQSRRTSWRSTRDTTALTPYKSLWHNHYY